MQDYKSLSVVVIICASPVDPKFDFYIMTLSGDLEMYIKPEVNVSVGAHVQCKFSDRRSVTCRDNTHVFSMMT